MTIKDKLELKLSQYNSEFDYLMNDKAMRDICFTACGCGNRATDRKLTAYRNKIGVIGNKIKALELALKIVNQESFMHHDIIEVYNYFLQLRNPELSYTISDRCLSFDAIRRVITLTIELFLPIGKNKVLDYDLKYDNEHGYISSIPLKV